MASLSTPANTQQPVRPQIDPDEALNASFESIALHYPIIRANESIACLASAESRRMAADSQSQLEESSNSLEDSQYDFIGSDDVMDSDDEDAGTVSLASSSDHTRDDMESNADAMSNDGEPVESYLDHEDYTPVCVGVRHVEKAADLEDSIMTMRPSMTSTKADKDAVTMDEAKAQTWSLRGFDLAPEPFRLQSHLIHVMLTASERLDMLRMDQILGQLSDALLESTRARSGEFEFEFARGSIKFGAVRLPAPKEELTASDAVLSKARPKIVVELCTLASYIGTGEPRSVTLGFRNGKSVVFPDCLKDKSSSFTLPDLVIEYYGESDDEKTIDHILTVRAFMSRSNVPIISISDSERLNPALALSTCRGSLFLVQDSPIEGRNLVKPIDLATFLNFDYVDLSRYIAHLTSRCRERKRSSEQMDHTRHQSVRRSLKEPSFRRFSAAFVVAVLGFLLLGLVRQGYFPVTQKDVTFRREALSSALIKLTNSTDMMKKIDVDTIIPNITPPSRVLLNSESSSERKDLALLQNDLFKAHVVGPYHIVLSLSQCLTRSGDPIVTVSRQGKLIKPSMSTRIDTNVIYIELNSDEAYGTTSINVRTLEQPSVDQTLKIGFGSRWLKPRTYPRVSAIVAEMVENNIWQTSPRSKVIEAEKILRKALRNVHTTYNQTKSAGKRVQHVLQSASLDIKQNACEGKRASIQRIANIRNSTTMALRKVVSNSARLAQHVNQRVGTLVLARPHVPAISVKKARNNALGLASKLGMNSKKENNLNREASSISRRKVGSLQAIKTRAENIMHGNVAPYLSHFVYGSPERTSSERKASAKVGKNLISSHSNVLPPQGAEKVDVHKDVVASTSSKESCKTRGAKQKRTPKGWKANEAGKGCGGSTMRP
ncbi:hypothetical protein LTR50_006790 [Elasticomyces elasticus]|nr:hypothetical protein LTR50_006790 [Elasticomyces elasticus]